MSRYTGLLGMAKGAWEGLNEWWLGISTAADPASPVDGGSCPSPASSAVGPRTAFPDTKGYASIDYLHIRRMRRFLAPSPADVFCDIGCGKGRVLCVFARKALRKCVGVELLPSLCERARENARRLRRRRTPISVACSDAATADIDEGTIYYFFNPFGPDTLARVLERIEGSLRAAPRDVRLVYHNACHAEVFDRCGWLELYHRYLTRGGLPVCYYRTRSAESVPGRKLRT
jgi:SAM-dependent methyltransferase